MKTIFYSLLLVLLLSNKAVYSQNDQHPTTNVVTIIGKVIDQTNKKPIANASVFLSNATVGDKTAADGTFTLHNVKPGKYNLVISIVGFENYQQSIWVDNKDVNLPDIEIKGKIITLSEVTIKSKKDPHRQQYFEWFVNEFLGTSDFAKDCKILNPEVLNLDYDDATDTLTASSDDFLIIENKALGYRIKYLLTEFIQGRKLSGVHFEGSALFEELQGSPAQKNKWQKKRMEVYEGSQMHFLRALLHNQPDESGFRVLQYAIYENPQRPADSLINTRITRYKKLKDKNSSYADSLSYWVKESKLPKTLKKLMEYPLTRDEIVRKTDQKGIYALGCENDALHITYSADRHFPKHGQLVNLNSPDNTETTIMNFNRPFVFFDNNGGVVNIGSFSLTGAWGRNRVAELLPLDYEPMPGKTANGDSILSIQNITSKLKTFALEHITEKTYLHFDKPYYATGDTVYFKAYVTMGERHQLSKLSGVLHIDLINTANKIDQSIKLQLIDGVAWGDFALPDSLPQGNYRVRAYTKWMCNDESSFFERLIPVGSLKNKKIHESNTTVGNQDNAKPDIQFFPEGGNLVTGIRSRIAFKAIGANGLGMDLKGTLLDNDNKVILTFASAHLGMGSFYFDPEQNKSYKAEISYANGIKDIIELPKANDKGIILSVNNDSIPKATVRIQTNQAYYLENKNKDYTLLIYSGGKITTVQCELDSTQITLDIIKRRLFTGVTSVTLLSPDNEPLCERLLFIQNYDQLALDVGQEKTKYAPRGKVNIKLNVKTRADSTDIGHFSVSVIDESKVPVDENTETTILTDLLLTSDLTGTIEQPNYYFTDISDKTASDLDLVMLTHGYRSFEWKQLLNNEYPPATYQPEKGLEISGTAKTILGKPLDHGTVSLISTIGGPVLSQATDNQGNFYFSNLIFMDTTHFLLNAINAQGKNNTQLIYTLQKPAEVNSLPAINLVSNMESSMAIYLKNNQQQQSLKPAFEKVRTLKEVKINDYHSSNLMGPGHVDQVLHLEDIESMGGSLSTKLNGRLHGIQIINGVPFLIGHPMRIYFDYNLVKSLNDIPPDDIETVEVLKFANAGIYGVNGGYGVIILTSKEGGGRKLKDIPSIGVLPITVQGFYKAREFYSPKYTAAIPQGNHPDWRSTIYWAPDVVTDKDGNASLEFYNADGQGSYRIVIEGMDEKGNIGRQVYRYKVE